MQDGRGEEDPCRPASDSCSEEEGLEALGELSLQRDKVAVTIDSPCCGDLVRLIKAGWSKEGERRRSKMASASRDGVVGNRSSVDVSLGCFSKVLKAEVSSISPFEAVLRGETSLGIESASVDEDCGFKNKGLFREARRLLGEGETSSKSMQDSESEPEAGGEGGGRFGASMFA